MGDIVSATLDEDLSFIDPKNTIAGRNAQDTNVLLTKLAIASISQFDVDNVKQKIISNKAIPQRKQSAKTTPIKLAEAEEENEQNQNENEENVQRSNTARRNAPTMPKLQLAQLQAPKSETNTNP